MSQPPQALAQSARGLDRFLGLIMLIATGCLVAGWILPMMTVKQLMLFPTSVSVISGLTKLWMEEQYLLFLLIAAFSMVFPAAKLLVAMFLWVSPKLGEDRTHRWLGRVEILGRWSMLDVFVSALVVVAIEVSLVADVELHLGIYFFCAAILLSMLTVQRMTHLARNSLSNSDTQEQATSR